MCRFVHEKNFVNRKKVLIHCHIHTESRPRASVHKSCRNPKLISIALNCNIINFLLLLLFCTLITSIRAVRKGNPISLQFKIKFQSSSNKFILTEQWMRPWGITRNSNRLRTEIAQNIRSHRAIPPAFNLFRFPYEFRLLMIFSICNEQIF